MRKKPSQELQELISQISWEYNLENDLIKKDSLLDKKLANAKDSTERVSLEILHSKEVAQALESKKPLGNVLPSLAIYKLVEGILNNESDISQFSINLQGKLKIAPDISEQISKKILNDPSFKKDVSAEPAEALTASNTTIVNQIKPKGISQELR